jgi:ssDNA-binding Zn-finger/Zn-ribbon topoisomerase 1
VTCPTCEGPMVPRTSTHGKFWGCAAFPKCRGTRDSMGEARRSFSDTDDARDDTALPSDRWRERDRRRW